MSLRMNTPLTGFENWSADRERGFVPLSGYRIVEMCSNVAGPYAGMILAQLGAEVIKIEPPEGDDARAFASRIDNESIVFHHFGAGKRSIVVDLKKPEGVAVARDLILSANVVLESMRPGSADKLGVGPEFAKESAPKVLYYDINAYGTGPLGRLLPGYDPLIQAFSGIMEMTGHDDSPPTRCAPSVVDLSTGQWVAMGVMAALFQIALGGDVHYIETALVDTAFNLIPYQATAARVTGQRPARAGSGNPIAAPYQCYRAKDGYLLIAAANERLWQALVRALETPELLSDERFQGVASRSEHRKELEAQLNTILSGDDVAHWIEQLERAHVPVGRVLGLEESVMSNVTEERQTFLDSGGVPLVRLPWLIDNKPLAWRRLAPKLGENSSEVLEEIGYDCARITELLDLGIIGVAQESPTLPENRKN